MSIAYVSIPYRQAKNLSITNILCLIGMFQSLIGRLKTPLFFPLLSSIGGFQSLIGRLKTKLTERIIIWFAIVVSIPYRQAKNQGGVYGGQWCRGVSIPYRQAKNFIISVSSPLGVKVSIPYRQAKNSEKMQLFKLQPLRFQSLIGRLKTAQEDN